MICIACRLAADAVCDDETRQRLHARCKGPGQCDCQHRPPTRTKKE